MNREHNLENLKEWCAGYYETTGLKVHPANVPAEVILDELLGNVASLRKYFDNLVSIYNDLNERLTALDAQHEVKTKKVKP